jgi:protein-disulfide isomerase
LTVPLSERDHVIGPASAPVSLVEYGDFECPYCGMAHPIIKEVRRHMHRYLRFAFRHFPLSSAHPHAEMASEAAEAAAAQGRFWEMHDTLYEHQDALEFENLVTYANVLGLEVRRFEKELAAHTYAGRVREDFLSGARSGVNGTPTFFINGQRYDGSWDFETLLAALEEAAGTTFGRS